jgi:hypothetical protein
VNGRLAGSCLDASMVGGLFRRTVPNTHYGEDIEVYVGGEFWIEWPGLPYSLRVCKVCNCKHSSIGRENDVVRCATFARNTMHACFGRVHYRLRIRRRALDQYRGSRESYAAENEVGLSVWKSEDNPDRPDLSA